jgi:deazaflavin-dependent oxidoreductase (nitroreductase family)
MPEEVTKLRLPRGLTRLALRLPIWLYRAGMGWVLGTRFVLLTHNGRKSGLPRQSVLEVVRYDKISRACIVASGWDTRSDWFQNITKNPRIVFQVRNFRSAGFAERLSPDDGAQELLDYSRIHPLAFRELAEIMGFHLEGSEKDILEAGRKLPLFIFKPDLPNRPEK